ncbi:anti-sigma factor [Kribbella sp. NBC_01505]|uniref:anti-sigma factor n=1 Tax=Kribbella sp. NBC_01505 TaxID=2903580 RepID=UPI0038693D8E
MLTEPISAISGEWPTGDDPKTWLRVQVAETRGLVVSFAADRASEYFVAPETSVLRDLVTDFVGRGKFIRSTFAHLGWLCGRPADGKRMVSLGVLNPTSGGTFQVPGQITAQGYRIVDVSLEPDDGNPEHSHDSIIRGTLPA